MTAILTNRQALPAQPLALAVAALLPLLLLLPTTTYKHLLGMLFCRAALNPSRYLPGQVQTAIPRPACLAALAVRPTRRRRTPASMVDTTSKADRAPRPSHTLNLPGLAPYPAFFPGPAAAAGSLHGYGPSGPNGSLGVVTCWRGGRCGRASPLSPHRVLLGRASQHGKSGPAGVRRFRSRKVSTHQEFRFCF